MIKEVPKIGVKIKPKIKGDQMSIAYLRSKWAGYLEGLQSLKNHGYGQREGVLNEISLVSRFLEDIDKECTEENIIMPQDLQKIRKNLRVLYQGSPKIKKDIDQLVYNALEKMPTIKYTLGNISFPAILDYFLIGESFIIKTDIGYDTINQDCVKIVALPGNSPMYISTLDNKQFAEGSIRHLKRGNSYCLRGSSVFSMESNSIKPGDHIEELKIKWNNLNFSPKK